MAADVDRVDVHGLTLAYRRVGHGPPSSCCTGRTRTAGSGSRQLDGLSDQFTVVAWDAPGCGLSTDPPETFTDADYSDCLAGFLDALNLSRCPRAGSLLGLDHGAGSLPAPSARHGLARPRLGVRRLGRVVAARGGAAASPPGAARGGAAGRGVRRTTGCPLSSLPRRHRSCVDEVIAIMGDFHPAGMRVAARTMARARLPPDASPPSPSPPCCSTASSTSAPRSTSARTCTHASPARPWSSCPAPRTSPRSRRPTCSTTRCATSSALCHQPLEQVEVLADDRVGADPARLGQRLGGVDRPGHHQVGAAVQLVDDLRVSAATAAPRRRPPDRRRPGPAVAASPVGWPPTAPASPARRRRPASTSSWCTR